MRLVVATQVETNNFFFILLANPARNQDWQTLPDYSEKSVPELSIIFDQVAEVQSQVVSSAGDMYDVATRTPGTVQHYEEELRLAMMSFEDHLSLLNPET